MLFLIQIFTRACQQVSPDLYGDNNTRLFTYWTVSFPRDAYPHWLSCLLYSRLAQSMDSMFLQSDAYQATGCYNLLCSGFIQVNSEIAMGASISPVSAYRNAQYDISILIWKVILELSSRQGLNSNSWIHCYGYLTECWICCMLL